MEYQVMLNLLKIKKAKKPAIEYDNEAVENVDNEGNDRENDDSQLVSDESAEIQTSNENNHNEVDGAEQEATNEGSINQKESEIIPSLNAGVGDDENTPTTSDAPASVSNIYDDGIILGLKIHQTDKFKQKVMITHPVVKIHLVDSITGLYFPKSSRKRPVCYFKEENISYILPIMTGVSDIARQKDNVPLWDELVILNENVTYFQGNCHHLLFLFEVTDFMTMSASTYKYQSLDEEEGWSRIAWAFYRPNSRSENPFCLGKRLRLQLYKTPRRLRSTSPKKPAIFQLWKSDDKVVHKNSLYVTFKEINKPNNLPSAMRSTMALQNEYMKSSNIAHDGDIFDTGITETTLDYSGDHPTPLVDELVWSRLPGQSCRMPNSLIWSNTQSKFGICQMVFSPNGKQLACACVISDTLHVIRILDVFSGRLILTCSSHGAMIYGLEWNQENRLLSASGDTTVKLWDPQDAQCIQVFSHPTFVYCVTRTADDLIFTCAFDGAIRLWKEGEGVHGEIVKRFQQSHDYGVYSTFHKDRNAVYVCTAKGVILMFVEKLDEKSNTKAWTMIKVCDDQDLQGLYICGLYFHPDKKRAIVTSKDCKLRILDIRSWSVIQRWSILNENTPPDFECSFISACLTPCGQFLISCICPSTTISVWHIETGRRLCDYPLQMSSRLVALCFHQHDDMLAISALGTGQPLQLYKYDSNSKDLVDLDLQKVKSKVEKMNPMVEVANFSAAKLLEQHKLLRILDANVDKKLNSKKKTKKVSLYESQPKVDEAQESKNPTTKVKALYKYKAQTDDEISFAKGETINIVSKDDSNWWVGFVRAGEKPGYFPSNYVQTD